VMRCERHVGHRESSHDERRDGDQDSSHAISPFGRVLLRK
jgi:hypothetical protein